MCPAHDEKRRTDGARENIHFLTHLYIFSRREKSKTKISRRRRLLDKKRVTKQEKKNEEETNNKWKTTFYTGRPFSFLLPFKSKTNTHQHMMGKEKPCLYSLLESSKIRFSQFLFSFSCSAKKNGENDNYRIL